VLSTSRWEILQATGSRFAGELGGVQLDGTFGGGRAQGTWIFEAICPDGTVCRAEGPWSALLKVERDLATALGQVRSRSTIVEVEQPQAVIDGSHGPPIVGE